jgi:uncharacterized protein YqgV (UPF0045/DUF77 family)
MSGVTAQVSLYPLRTAHLGPTIERAVAVFRAAGIEVMPGAMSTVVAGDAGAVFAALHGAFTAAEAGDQPLVMVVTISNACPAQESDSGA